MGYHGVVLRWPGALRFSGGHLGFFFFSPLLCTLPTEQRFLLFGAGLSIVCTSVFQTGMA
jgi:hypothetical protein